MKCEKIQELILTDYLDGEMGAEQLKQVEKHLATCAHCRESKGVVKQAAIEPFENVEKVSPPESVWYRIKETIEENKGKKVFAYSLENLRTVFSVKRPAFALSVAAIILIISVLAIQLFPFQKQPDTEDVVNVYLEEQIEYLANLDDMNGDFNVNFGTGIENYFLSEGNF